MTEKELLQNILVKWDKLKPGAYTKEVIEIWLLNEMKPAIKQIRNYLNA